MWGKREDEWEKERQARERLMNEVSDWLGCLICRREYIVW